MFMFHCSRLAIPTDCSIGWAIIFFIALNISKFIQYLSNRYGGGVRYFENESMWQLWLNVLSSFHWLGWALRWCHNGRDGVSNHQPDDCLLNRLFRCRSKKTSKLRVTGPCAGNSPGTGEFPAQKASNAENVSIWWHHHEGWESALSRPHHFVPIRPQDSQVEHMVSPGSISESLYPLLYRLFNQSYLVSSVRTIVAEGLSLSSRLLATPGAPARHRHPLRACHLSRGCPGPRRP